ncbi:hypothetical protein H5410_049274 [Solanum commersonii]|uniref:Uncharacterized protein n=1 Tax=Solanum commersonii TaxID=4109 RepID=A0A9J5XP25_SOLCO|nr:hypothetical protein H5410_049274 [Solanum commersonii]
MDFENYMDWLDTMIKESVIYIAFGSYRDIKSIDGGNRSRIAYLLGMPIGGRCGPIKVAMLSSFKMFGRLAPSECRRKVSSKRDEFKRCIDIVMEDGEKRRSLRRMPRNGRILAKEAMKENGSSNVNLKAYVNEILLIKDS